MDLLTLTRLYLAVNAALIVAWLLLALGRTIGGKSQPISLRAQLAFGYVALVAAVATPIAATFSGEDYLPRAAQVWSAPTMRAVAQPASSDHMTMPFAAGATTVAWDGLALAIAAMLMVAVVVAMARFAVGLAGALRIIRASHALRRRDSLRIVASDSIDVPFSFWIPGRYYIALPSSLLANPPDLRLAIRHEAQHHRQGDTKVLYVLQLLLGICCFNPAAYGFARRIRELQEFVCDESVVRQRRVSTEAYCHCLVRIAEQAREQRPALVCMSMADAARGTVFYRRIEIMLNRPLHNMNRAKTAALAAAGLALLSIAAVGAAASIKDRRVTLDDAHRMAAVARANSAFPIVVNDSVLQELNRYLGTPDGRAFVRDSLGRMRAHRALIGEKLEQYALPEELLAVPLVESGYRNLPANEVASRGAGIWMFIAPTARRYSLRVDGQADERLDVAAETDAAMRMFSDLHRQFGDWGLALLAYNAGNALVEQGIRETGSRDVWGIVGQGYENDRDYVPRVMAAILIMQNPDALD